MASSITITEKITIEASPGAVWDYTQDFNRRTEWDGSVLGAEMIGSDLERAARVRYKGGLECTFQYKLFERPTRTTLAMTDVRSPIFSGGGGSWRYQPAGVGTEWTQVNTLTFRNPMLYWLLRWPIAWGLRRSTRQGMLKVKGILEGRLEPGILRS